MKLITTSKDLERQFIKLLKKYKYISFATAWASSEHFAFQELLKLKRKIKKSTIGLHFYQTDPKVLELFKDDENIKFIWQTTGVFHPKIYIFWNSDDDWSILLGSANFTNSAFAGNNIEQIILVESISQDKNIFIDSKKFIKKCFDNSDAVNLTDTQIENYINQYRRRELNLKKLSNTYPKSNSQVNFLDIDILNYSWDKYLYEIKKDPEHGFSGRIDMLNKIQKIFNNEQANEFYKLDKDNINHIMGLYYKKEYKYYAWFGHLTSRLRAGLGENLHKNIQIISKAIDLIPKSGQVDRNLFLEYIKLFYSAFEKNELAAATRLLAMKRPDLFFCKNEANIAGIASDLGIRKSNITAEYYWDEIIERFHDTPWFNSSKPKNKEDKSAWKYRVALIDCIYYKS